MLRLHPRLDTRRTRLSKMPSERLKREGLRMKSLMKSLIEEIEALTERKGAKTLEILKSHLNVVTETIVKIFVKMSGQIDIIKKRDLAKMSLREGREKSPGEEMMKVPLIQNIEREIKKMIGREKRTRIQEEKEKNKGQDLEIDISLVEMTIGEMTIEEMITRVPMRIQSQNLKTLDYSFVTLLTLNKALRTSVQ